MDKELEIKIVKRFFSKRIQDRVIFELSSKKKRIEALSRLCHNYENTLVPDYMVKIPSPNSDYQEIASLLKKQGAPNECYVISWDQETDGRHLPLNEALKKVVGYGMPSIVRVLKGKLLILKLNRKLVHLPDLY